MTKQPLTKTRTREVLEQARMDIAQLLASSYETHEEIHRLLSITGELWEGILHEEAPEMRVTPHMVKAS